MNWCSQPGSFSVPSRLQADAQNPSRDHDKQRYSDGQCIPQRRKKRDVHKWEDCKKGAHKKPHQMPPNDSPGLCGYIVGHGKNNECR